MTDAAPENSAVDPKATPTDLLENLRELGEALPVSFQPTSHSAAPIVAGVVWYLATGSLVPPAVVAPDEAAARLELAETTALNEANARIAELERQNAAAGASPSPVAPAPVVPVEPAPTPPVAAPPVATPPVAPTPVDPVAAAPAEPAAINADVPPVGAPPTGA